MANNFTGPINTEGSFEIPDWLSSFGSGGDPVAGSSWSDVIGNFDPAGSGFGLPDWFGSLGHSGDPIAQGGYVSGGQQNLGGSFIDQLLGNPQGWADASSVLGSLSSGEKANRLLKGNFTQNYDRLMMDAQTNRNQNESDALRKLGQTGYITSGGSPFKPPTISLNGQSRTTPDFGYGPQAPSEMEKQGASALQDQLVKRLQPGGSYTPQPLEGYANPGTLENLSSYGGAASGGVGALGSILGYPQGQQNSGGNFLSNIPWGKVGKSIFDFFGNND